MNVLIKNITPEVLPLYLLIRTPSMLPSGKTDGGTIPKASYDFILIDKPGNYKFSLEKTSIIRLPSPYSDPSCVKQNSDTAMMKNIFTGNYTIGACIATCITKSELKYCRSAAAIYRYLMREEEFLRSNFEDQPVMNIEKCLLDRKEDIEEHREICVTQCHNPCFEQNFKAIQTFTKGEGENIWLSFYYEDRKETFIKEVPSYELETLLSNFGGQLGLMVGMSALSIMEVLIWFILLLVECLYRIGM